MNITKLIQFATAWLLTATSWCHGGLESFTFLNAPGSTYSSGYYTGDDGNLWSFAGVRTVRTSYVVDGVSAGFGDATLDSRYLETNVGIDGIGGISLQARSYFTAGKAADRVLRVLLDNEEVGQFTLSEMNRIESWVLNDINYPGPLTLRLESIGSRQLVIDNVQWTPSPPPMPAPAAPLQLIVEEEGRGAVRVRWQQPAVGDLPRGYCIHVVAGGTVLWPEDGTTAEARLGWTSAGILMLVAGNETSAFISGVPLGVELSIWVQPWSNQGRHTKYTPPQILQPGNIILNPEIPWPLPVAKAERLQHILTSLLGRAPGSADWEYWWYKYVEAGENEDVWMEALLRSPPLLQRIRALSVHYLLRGYYPDDSEWYQSIWQEAEQTTTGGLIGLAAVLMDESELSPAQTDVEFFQQLWKHRHQQNPTLAQHWQAVTRLEFFEQHWVDALGESGWGRAALVAALAANSMIDGQPVITGFPNTWWERTAVLALLGHAVWADLKDVFNQQFLQTWSGRSAGAMWRYLTEHARFWQPFGYHWLGAWARDDGWRFLPGLGWLHYTEPAFPWIWLKEHGWWYTQTGPRPGEDSYVWSADEGWGYIHRSWVPWIYYFNSGDWVLLEVVDH